MPNPIMETSVSVMPVMGGIFQDADVTVTGVSGTGNAGLSVVWIMVGDSTTEVWTEVETQ